LKLPFKEVKLKLKIVIFLLPLKTASGKTGRKSVRHTEVEFNQAIIQTVSAKKLDNALSKRPLPANYI